MFAHIPLNVVDQGVVFSDSDVGLRAAPVRRGRCTGKGNGGEATCGLTSGEASDSQRGRSIGWREVGIEGGTVVTGVSILELVDDLRREDMGLFDDANRGLRC